MWAGAGLELGAYAAVLVLVRVLADRDAGCPEAVGVSGTRSGMMSTVLRSYGTLFAHHVPYVFRYKNRNLILVLVPYK